MLSAVVLTRNEADNLPRVLASLKFCDEIVVVDNNSTDNSAKIATKSGARVLKHALTDFSKQRNWALEQVKTSWVLFVDADEEVSPELAQEIVQSIQKIEYKGFLIPRHDYLWGKRLKYGDLWGFKVLRLARRGAGDWTGAVHESWKIEGRVGVLKNSLRHYPHANIVEFLRSINTYSSLKAREFFEMHRKTNVIEITLGPVYRFLLLYIGKFGFLDGTAGFIHAMVMSFYMFLVAGKLYLLSKNIGDE
jgi:glycosyltransferase involved in cell wall biosynthesis